MSLPYEAPKYFVMLTVLFLPIIIGLLNGKRFLIYQNLVTLGLLYVTFGGSNWKQGISIIVYVIWQVLLVYLYHRYRMQKMKRMSLLAQ